MKINQSLFYYNKRDFKLGRIGAWKYNRVKCDQATFIYINPPFT